MLLHDKYTMINTILLLYFLKSHEAHASHTYYTI